MKKVVLAVPFLALAACSTPYEQCEQAATEDYSALLSAIAETEANISRGYAIHRDSVPYTYQGTCYSAYIGTYQCPQTGYRTQETPVSINVAEERVKLNRLNRLVPDYRARAENAVQQCRVQFPEG